MTDMNDTNDRNRTNRMIRMTRMNRTHDTDMNAKNQNTKTEHPNPTTTNPNPPNLGPPRASVAALEELHWFFEYAAGEIEVPSNYEPMVRRLIYGALHEDTEQFDVAAERRVEALHAARTIYERLGSLPSYARWVIRTIFDPALGSEVAREAAEYALAEYEKTRVGFPGSVVPEPEVGR
jgi:hypothetical protein